MKICYQLWDFYFKSFNLHNIEASILGLINLQTLGANREHIDYVNKRIELKRYKLERID